MQEFAFYSLPFLLDGQYMLTSVLKEYPDRTVYAATQMDVRREVLVESLRPELVADPEKVDDFVQSARAQARFDSKLVASVLQLFYAAGTWHVVRERIFGEPLDALLAAGRKLSAAQVIELLMLLCRGCLYMDIEGLACRPFSMEHAFLLDYGFRFDNRACAGPRRRDTSHRFLRDAEHFIQPLLDTSDPHAGDLYDLLTRMGCEGNWDTLGVLRFHEELARMQVHVGLA